VKTRRPLAVLAATAVAGLGLTALATPASANTTSVSVEKDSGPVFSPNSVTGTRFTLTNNMGTGFTLYLLDPIILDSSGDPCSSVVADAQCKLTNGQTATFLIAPGANGVSVNNEDSNTDSGSFTVTYVGESSSSSGSVSGTTPAPVIQQFEKPTTGTCDEAQPEGLNWGGAASGGWGESWAQWMHEGQGGAVCTRTLAYNNSTATWQAQ